MKYGQLRFVEVDDFEETAEFFEWSPDNPEVGTVFRLYKDTFELTITERGCNVAWPSNEHQLILKAIFVAAITGKDE